MVTIIAEHIDFFGKQLASIYRNKRLIADKVD